MSLRFLSIFIILMVSVSGFAQKLEVSGTAADINNKALPDVIIKITDGSTTFAFTTTDAQGRYSLSFERKIAKGKDLWLQIQHISYEGDTIALAKDKEKIRHDIILIPKSIELKEVQVRAQPLHVKGDTLRYNLASFLGKGDVSLEDGLRRLPGVDISASGAISYMGKSISNFYIEGLELLGGRYNLATKNIPAQYTTQVEVLRHHNHRRVDADKASDNVAINVKLSKKAKVKPFGRQEFGLGLREEDAIAAIGLTEMLFTDNFQLLGSAKYSNYGDLGSYDLTNHFYDSRLNPLAEQLLCRWKGGQTPIGDYQYQRTGYGSFNAICKFGEGKTLRVNADYSYERNNNEYSAQTAYFANGQNISVAEVQHPFERTHKPSLDLRYVNNIDDKYVSESLNIRASLEEDDDPVNYTYGNNSALNTQHRDNASLLVQNEYYTTVKRGDNYYSLSSNVLFSRAPEVMLKMNDISQRAQSTSLQTMHRTSLQYGSGNLKIDIPVSLQADYDFVETVLTGTPGNDNTQEISGWRAVPSVSPGTYWDSADKRIHLQMSVGVSWLNMEYKSALGNKEKTTVSELQIEPSLNFRYTFSGMSEITLDSYANDFAGDILDLITGPVQVNYRNSSIASGIIGKTKNWITSLLYKYQIPFSFFALNARAAWSQGKRNVLSSQMVESTNVNMSSVVRDSHFESATASVDISKNYIPINTKLVASASGRWSRNESMSQNRLVTTYSQGFTLTGKATVSPARWTEISGQIDYSKSLTRFDGTHNICDDLDVSGFWALYPTKSLEFRVTYDYVHHQIAKSEFKDASLLYASLQYKVKQAIWKLKLDNLLDTRHYSYTTYTGTDRYSYDCSLIGRTISLTCILNIN